MFWTIEKLNRRIEELYKYRYREKILIPFFLCCSDDLNEINPPIAAKEEFTGILKLGDSWEGRDKYLWLYAEVEIPQYWQGKKIVGVFDFGKTGPGTNSGFESLIYVNGKPHQGVDSNHKEVFFSNEIAGKKLELVFRLWSGLEGGGEPKKLRHTIQSAFLSWMDENVDELYFTSRALLDTIKILEESRTERIDLLKALDKAFQMIDWSSYDVDGLYKSIKEANEYLQTEIEGKKKASDITITCIGHTHIDVAWLWRLKHTREKCARSFSTVLRLMEQYSEYLFLQSQPQLYEYIKEDYPEIYEKIKERVKEGRWEAGGAMWLESDTNIPSGESLVRQILMGTNFFKEEFGVNCSYLWLPDVFGYSWALPQILKKSGIDVFVTTKISWNQYNRIPHDTFYWRGIDGSEVLAHFVTTPNINWVDDFNKTGVIHHTYNGVIHPSTVQGIWNQYQDKDINRNLIFSYGYGDGGGGVNRQMLETRRCLDKIPGLPKVKTGRADEYFRSLKERLDNTDSYVHTWDGELYLEFHRGTYTTQGLVKKMNRKLELFYRDTEVISIFSNVIDNNLKDYPQKKLLDGWKIILRNQFHDIITGTSIREVYEDAINEYKEANKIAEEIKNESIENIIEQKNNKYSVFNNSNWYRSDLVRIQGERHGVWLDEKGSKLVSQVINGETVVYIENIQPMSFTNIEFYEGKKVISNIPFKLYKNGIKTPFYEIEWNDKGQITRIYDITLDKEVIADGGKANVLQIIDDRPITPDAWEVESYYYTKAHNRVEEVDELVSVDIVGIGELEARITFNWKYKKTIIKQEMILYSKNKRIDFKTVVDWKEHQKLLKSSFEVNVRSTHATYDIQFGNIKRPIHWNTSWDLAKFEVVGHQWADLSERNFGVSLLNDCKYGYDIKDNRIRLSLVRGPIYPDPKADEGIHEFTYSLLPHKGDWYEGNTVQNAWNLNNPLFLYKGQAKDSQKSLFKISSKNVFIDAVKKAEKEDLVALRIHEFAGSSEKVKITSDFKIVSWQECNLLEERVGEFRNTDVIEVGIKPYEIKTFLIDLKK
ncbi:alpha-mannosidase [Caloranaerobacter sp. TR13]|uniref:alpha-mannosidase n=1 Tax=Caloranaerobacter sp. TR13 TaxID=1302151 RepID=UPI0006D44BD2|nr:alpha-mannosidase [Caloranaerobacter sp. TR13]KPU27623.1 alpha-mannosidase [Caloranaerobacter sp. TR13]